MHSNEHKKMISIHSIDSSHIIELFTTDKSTDLDVISDDKVFKDPIFKLAMQKVAMDFQKIKLRMIPVKLK